MCRTLNRAGFKIGARQIFFVCHVTGLEGEPDVVRNTRADGRSKEFQQEFRNKITDRPAQQQILPVSPVDGVSMHEPDGLIQIVFLIRHP